MSVGFLLILKKLHLEINMKKVFSSIILIILFAGFAELVFAQKCPPGSVRVRGYRTRKGKVIKPHCRTRADRSKRNNWSTKGNRNPVTKKRGWIRVR